jgi:hypothetical protein
VEAPTKTWAFPLLVLLAFSRATVTALGISPRFYLKYFWPESERFILPSQRINGRNQFLT